MEKITEFTTSRGYTLKLRAVSQLLMAEVMGQITEPEAPTYTVETKAGPQTFRHYHDPDRPEKSTLKTDEQRAAWTEYEARHRDYLLERNKRLMMVYIDEGIIDPPMPSEEWAKRMKRYNIQLPTERDELIMKFYEYEVFGSQSDMMQFMLQIMQAGGDISEERIDAIEASFRRSLENVTGLALEDTAGGVELQQVTGDSESGAVLEQDAAGIRDGRSAGQGDDDSGVSDRCADDGVGE